MCDSSCWYARSPSSTCHCDCHGRNHGRGRGGFGYGYGGFRSRRPNAYSHLPKLIITQPPRVSKSTQLKNYLVAIGKSALTSALMSGFLAALPPPIGAVAIPAYTAYNYSKLGFGLFNACKNILSGRDRDNRALKEIASDAEQSLTGPVADNIASKVVNAAQANGSLKDIADKTKIPEIVFAEMLKGSTSSALTSAMDLSEFAIKKIGG